MKQAVPSILPKANETNILPKVKDIRHAHVADASVPGQSEREPKTASLAQRRMVLL